MFEFPRAGERSELNQVTCHPQLASDARINNRAANLSEETGR
ncbi:MAG: hypothetical protein AAFN77_13710 [Planctomycetota bacterium]